MKDRAALFLTEDAEKRGVRMCGTVCAPMCVCAWRTWGPCGFELPTACRACVKLCRTPFQHFPLVVCAFPALLRVSAGLIKPGGTVVEGTAGNVRVAACVSRECRCLPCVTLGRRVGYSLTPSVIEVVRHAGRCRWCPSQLGSLLPTTHRAPRPSPTYLLHHPLAPPPPCFVSH